jgi:sodium-coupled monocarboxylate transporter 8/12
MLNLIDIFIIVLYLAGTIATGILCRGKQEDTDDYFTTKGGMGGFFASILVGLSIAATLFSGISFLAYPSLVYSNGIGILFGVVNFFIAWVVLVFWFLPRYLSASGTQHPYDIIELRLGSKIRTLAAFMYVLLRIGWMAALIYAPTIAIMAATGLGGPKWFWAIVLTIGIISTVYTTLGGIRGVIVTDAIQFVVIAIGVTLTITVVLFRLPVPFSELISFLNNNGRLQLFDFSPDPTKLITVWSILIGVNIANFSMYMADQMSLQRYLAAGSIKAVSRSFLANTVGVMIVLILLGFVGLSLFAWYHYNPDPNLPDGVDKIFPYFVSTQLPPGIAGLILAAILAATMSSMTSGINTLSATLSLDFRARMGRPMTPKQQLNFSRKISIVVGLASTFAAGLVKSLGNIFEMTQALLGLFLGPILTCMFLAVLNKKVNTASLIIGLIAALVVGSFVTYSPIANPWVPGVTFFVSITITYTGTLLFGINNSVPGRN